MRVTVTGAEFAPGAHVYFGSKAASNITDVSSTEIIASSPTATGGTVDVTVTTPDGTSATSSGDRFTYVSPPPTVAVTGPSNSFQLSGYVTTTYSATDAYSTIGSYDVRYRVVSWNGALGQYVDPSGWQKTTRTSETLVGTPGREYCFDVRARTTSGTLSAWSPDHCGAIPLGAGALSMITSGWVRGTGSAYYLDAYAKTTVFGAELRLGVAELDRMALVVTRCSACGSVAIYLNGVYWRTVSTYGATTKHQVILLQPTFSLRKATIVLKDVSKGKQLIVEGLGLSHN